MSGRGNFNFFNQDEYIGDFKSNYFHGKGTYYYADGDRYDGYWKFD